MYTNLPFYESWIFSELPLKVTHSEPMTPGRPYLSLLIGPFLLSKCIGLINTRPVPEMGKYYEQCTGPIPVSSHMLASVDEDAQPVLPVGPMFVGPMLF